MPLEEQTHRYKVVIQFDSTGGLAGAHQEFITVVRDIDTGEVRSEARHAARGLDPATLGDILSEHLLSLGGQVQTLAAARDALVAELATVTAERDQARATVAQLAALNADLERTLAARDAQIAAFAAA